MDVNQQSPSTAERAPLAGRITASVIIGLASALISYRYWGKPHERLSDFAQVWMGARALLAGENPYLTIGPGNLHEWDFPLFYPLPAVVAAIPFAFMSLLVANTIFVGLGAGLLAWALTRRRLDNPQLLVFLSIAFLNAVQTSQWSPLLTGAALVPAWGMALACKPTLGLALLMAYPNLRAVLGAGIFALGVTVVWPWWPSDWLGVLPAGVHIVPPITRPGGFLVLLALLRWRDPDARLLVALAAVPQTPLLYEAVPLFLVVRRWSEAVGLSALMIVTWIATGYSAPYADYNEWLNATGQYMMWLLYLPCVALVLSRRVDPQVREGGIDHLAPPPAPDLF